MLDHTKLATVKAATVAIGLSEVGAKDPFEILGTGFVIQDDVIATAAHVITGSLLRRDELLGQGKNTVMKAFHAESSTSGPILESYDFDEPYGKSIMNIKLIPGSANYVGPHDLDLGFIKLAKEAVPIPSLGFAYHPKNLLYEEVAMCGYPGGSESLNVTKLEAGLRLDPVMQFGRVSSLFPNDDSEKPLGLQTDIIATGGSSGSPIVNLAEGQVVAIAQNVIPAEVLNSDATQLLGFAKGGLVYGVSTGILSELYQWIHEYFYGGMPSFTSIAGAGVFIGPLNLTSRISKNV